MPHLLGATLWNLFLAAIPVILAQVLVWGLGRGKSRRLPWWLAIPIAIVWLLFLPNTCYLLTEWRHLLLNPSWADIIGAPEDEPQVMLAAAKWSLFYLAYSGLGMLLFVLAVRPLEGWLRARRVRSYLWAPPLFLLTSLGVYLGLRLRLNSWDALRHPHGVWLTALDRLANPAVLVSICVFAVVLWAMYEAVDLWVDGAVQRLRDWGVLEAPRASH